MYVNLQLFILKAFWNYIYAIFLTIVKELVEENKQLEEGMKEILQAIKDMQKDSVKGGDTALMIPSLERLVNVSLTQI